jgi:hypothetical protein
MAPHARATATGEVRGALLVRDILDAQLETADRRRVGRVGDLEATWQPDGRLHLTAILVGPQVLLGRISRRLRGVATRLLGNRFAHRIDIDQVEEVGPTVRLIGRVTDYSVAAGDAWIAEHVLRFIPGSGRKQR